MDGLVLEHACAADENAVLSLYRSQIGFGTSDWDETYPGPDEIREDTQRGWLYLLRGAEGLVAAVSLLEEDEHCATLPCWTPAHAAYLSRLCIAPAMQGHGMAARMLTAVSGIAREKGFAATRHLCSKINTAAVRLYTREGYILRGECYLFDTDFFCFEKFL